MLGERGGTRLGRIACYNYDGDWGGPFRGLGLKYEDFEQLELFRATGRSPQRLLPFSRRRRRRVFDGIGGGNGQGLESLRC
jgi:hypothetical protein